jgi:hypothetical protein
VNNMGSRWSTAAALQAAATQHSCITTQRSSSSSSSKGCGLLGVLRLLNRLLICHPLLLLVLAHLLILASTH